MIKTNEQLLADYKKSNKVRRKQIRKKAGFTSEKAYLHFFLSTPSASVEDGLLDQVIAFDTTGSMAGYISAVKKHVSDLIPRLFAENPLLQMKIVAFGDYCDMPAAYNFGKAYQESPLTNDQNVLINFVNTAQNTSGGDLDEFYELVIKKITDETPWRNGSKRALLLIGDCNPHPVGYSYGLQCQKNIIDWKLEAAKASMIGLEIDTLSCGNQGIDFYTQLSNITNGIHLPFSTQEKTSEAIYATTSVRGSSVSKIAFAASYTSAVADGDIEMVGTYKALSTKL